MTLATTGIVVRTRSRGLASAVELVSSMRFSISLLTVICIASVIGTVVRQHEPYSNYVNQFGPFWTEVFAALGLLSVYSAWWFLLILAFLVVSTSLCVARNAPKIVADLRTYKEQMREQSLGAFHHRGSAESAETLDAAHRRIVETLAAAGWRTKSSERDHGTMVAARRGATNKLGYLAAHSAIVLICIGGLLDGDLVLRLQMALQGKTPYTGGGTLRDVPARHRLDASTPTFRANLLVPEGSHSGTAVVNLSDGVVLQDLPFDIELKKFIVEYYDTGMPKLFASEIVIHDRDTGARLPAIVKVNQPAHHRGVAIYQSSFDDGGSAVTLHAIPMSAGGLAFDVSGTIGESTRISNGAEQLQLEFAGLRVINVENLGAAGGDGVTDRETRGNGGTSGNGGAGGTDLRKPDLVGRLAEHLGSGVRTRGKKTLRNVGPSVSYKLRDAAGQAREFNNYLLPVELDGLRVFLAGARDKADQPMRYLRIPADDHDRIDGWVRLRHALLDPALRRRAVERYVAIAAPADKPELGAQLTTTAERVLGLFAGADGRPASKRDAPPAAPSGGLQAISDFIEGSVPEGERARISDVLLRILNGSLVELANLTRADAGEPALAPNAATQVFMTQSVLSLSDSFYYPAPVLLELKDFRQVQASVFQVTRAPGQTLVYLGAGLLIVGVFTMLYIRERRLWVWLVRSDRSLRITAAMSTSRRTLDADAEFDRLKQSLLEPRA